MSTEPIAVRLFDAGYIDLLPVIPPSASLTPSSRIKRDQLGKVPGKKLDTGVWAGYGWLKAPKPTREEVMSYAQWGANIGLRAANFPGLDIDCTDAHLAQLIENEAIVHLGPAPVRVGLAPKRLLVYVTDAPFERMAITFTVDGVRHLVEVLCVGRQYLLTGQHPSGCQYTWPRDSLWDVPAEGLVEIDVKKVGAFFDHLVKMLAGRGVEAVRIGETTGNRQAVPQDSLLAPSIEVLAEVVAMVPNADEQFPDREAYIKFGHAIRAAAGDEYDEGLRIFQDWALSRDPDGRVEGDPETSRGDYRKFRSPFVVGWDWVARCASRHGYVAAADEFPAEDPPAPPPPVHSDAWLVELTLSRFGSQLRHTPGAQRWYVWDGVTWSADAVALARQKVKEACTDRGIAVANGSTGKGVSATARRLASTSCHAAVTTQLSHHPLVAIPLDAFDRDPWLLNTPGGVVDLRTGHVRGSDPDALCSKCTSVAPDHGAVPARWLQFLEEVTGRDDQLELYLQAACGYACVGVTTEQVLQFFHGAGGNGKSVFVNTIVGILHGYATPAPMDTFTASGTDRHPTELAALMGARLVTSTETQAGRRWDEARVKTLTGGDPISARFMRGDFFRFIPQFLLWLSGNHMPELRSVDPAMRRRIHRVPFNFVPVKPDPLLMEALRAEWPAILAWMLRGTALWRHTGLCAPPSVVAATDAYLDEEDAVGRFLGECTVLDRDAEAELADLWQQWQRWAIDRNEHVGSMKALSQALASHGLRRTRTVRTRRSAFAGLAMKG